MTMRVERSSHTGEMVSRPRHDQCQPGVTSPSRHRAARRGAPGQADRRFGSAGAVRTAPSGEDSESGPRSGREGGRLRSAVSPTRLAERRALTEPERLPRADLERRRFVGGPGRSQAAILEPEAEVVGVLSWNASTTRPRRAASTTWRASPSTTMSRPSQPLQPVVTTTWALPAARFRAFCSDRPVTKCKASSTQTPATVVTCGRPSTRTVESHRSGRRKAAPGRWPTASRSRPSC